MHYFHKTPKIYFCQYEKRFAHSKPFHFFRYNQFLKKIKNIEEKNNIDFVRETINFVHDFSSSSGERTNK